MSRDIEVMRDISSHVFIQTMSKIIRWTRGTCLSAFVKTKKSLHLEYVHYHPIKSFQSVKIQKQTRWSVKNWRDLPTVPRPADFIVVQISVLEKQNNTRDMSVKKTWFISVLLMIRWLWENNELGVEMLYFLQQTKLLAVKKINVFTVNCLFWTFHLWN